VILRRSPRFVLPYPFARKNATFTLLVRKRIRLLVVLRAHISLRMHKISNIQTNVRSVSWTSCPAYAQNETLIAAAPSPPNHHHRGRRHRLRLQAISSITRRVASYDVAIEFCDDPIVGGGSGDVLGASTSAFPR